MYSCMQKEISRCVKTYKTITATPITTGAKILPSACNDSICIRTMWLAQDFVEFQKNSFFRDFVIEKGSFKVLSSGIPIDMGSVLIKTRSNIPTYERFDPQPGIFDPLVENNVKSHLHAFSKSGRKQAVFAEKNSPEKRIYLEIWNGSNKEATFNVTASKEHGAITENDPFKCFEWSSNEKFILYAAEEKQPKNISYFADTFQVNDGTGSVVMGEEHLYRQEWGECCVGSYHTVLCILEIETGLIEVLPTSKIGSDFSFGQARWGPNDETVIFIGWTELPYKAGVWGHNNRRNALYAINLKSKHIECLTPDENTCVRSPRFSPNLDNLIYFENSAGGPFFKGSKLKMHDWLTKKTSTIFDVVEDVSGDDFPGIYVQNLPSYCWSEDGKAIYFSSVWRSRLVIVCIDVENGDVQKVRVDEQFASAFVFEVKDNLLVAVLSAPNIDPCLVIGQINTNNRAVIEWIYLDSKAPVIHSDINWNIKRLIPTVPNEKYPYLDFEIIVISPTTKEKKYHLIVMPHGGPHWFSPVGFHSRCISFVKLGYIVCLVNYRGSLGFGESNLNSLPGNIGTQDVADVQQSVLYVKNNCGLNIGDVFGFGLCYGGFITAHLCGKYPDFFKAAVLINPVIDLSNFRFMTDSTDWSWVEAGLGDNFDFSTVLQPDQLKTMWEKSPIRYLENVRAPILLLLGKKDIRVHMSQGLEYYQLLKARKASVRLCQYDDGHFMLKTTTDGDIFIKSALWFYKHSFFLSSKI